MLGDQDHRVFNAFDLVPMDLQENKVCSPEGPWEPGRGPEASVFIRSLSPELAFSSGYQSLD